MDSVASQSDYGLPASVALPTRHTLPQKLRVWVRSRLCVRLEGDGITHESAFVYAFIPVPRFSGSFMLIYIIDDRGPRGEYANFIQAYETELPPLEFKVFTHHQALVDAIAHKTPDGILADMRFDETPLELLYGDIDALADTDQFCGNKERAEAQIRGMQGLLIIRALRERGILIPAILFAPFPDPVRNRIMAQTPNLTIIDGLLLHEIKTILVRWNKSV